MLTNAQKTTLKAAIEADNALNAKPNNPDGNAEILLALMQAASPDYYVWRSNVSRADVYNLTGDGSSSWDWTLYKGQAVAEQNAWTQMFMGDQANFGLLNIRVGVGKIFTGSAQQNAQRDHVLSVGRRKATVLEKILAVAVISPPANTGNNTGTARGTTTNPDLLGFEGSLTTDEIEAARNFAG